MCEKVDLNISRHGDNLFVQGLNGRLDDVLIVPALTKNPKKHMKVEPGGRAYLQVENYGRWGFVARIVRSLDDYTLMAVISSKSHKRVTFDPWEYVKRFDLWHLRG